MSAAMELHVALSLRLDATEAYRLAHAYRDEVRLQDAARLLDERRDHLSRNSFCNGIVHCANRLKEWAGGGIAPAPAPDNETAILRGLLRAVECAAQRGDLATVRRALADHARDTKGERRD